MSMGGGLLCIAGEVGVESGIGIDAGGRNRPEMLTPYIGRGGEMFTTTVSEARTYPDRK